MAKHKVEYRKGDFVVVIDGPYSGEKGIIRKVHGFVTKAYDVALTEHVGKVLRKYPAHQLSLDKS